MIHIKYVRLPSRSGCCFTFLTPCSSYYGLYAWSPELHEWTTRSEKKAAATVKAYGEDEKRTRGAELGGEEAVVCGC